MGRQSSRSAGPGHPLRRSSPFYLGFVAGLGVFAAYVVVQAVVQARQVLVLIAVSLFLAIGLNPLVERLVSRGVQRKAAVAVVGVLMVLVFVGFIAAIAPPLATQTADLLTQLPDNLLAIPTAAALLLLFREVVVPRQENT